MSNEELVAAIQVGATERMEELWEQVRRFIAMKAHHIMTALKGRADVEIDDLIQSGYLALVAAVSDYKPGNGLFLTHLGYHLKKAFAEATRFRSLRQQRETHAGTLSLDTPVTDGSNASTLGNFQENPAGVAALENVEERIYQDQLRKVMAGVLANLPEEKRELLRLRYWEDATLQEIASIQGTSPENIRRLVNRTLREIRRPRYACHLRPFYDFDFYCGTGIGTFQHLGMSIQERYLILEEDRKERAEQRWKEREEKQRKESFQSKYEEIMDRTMQEAQEKVPRMTPEGKRALLEKHGYA